MALRTMAALRRRRPDDEKEFERLYERHVRSVYRYAAAMLGDPNDAEDVTQTTFLNAYRAYTSGTRPEKPQGWLIAIAHNVCRQRFRQAQRRPHEVAFDERIGEGDVPEEITAPTIDELKRALSQLPPNQRAAIVMRELEGGSYAEIAEVLGISVSALETLLFRARRALREQLEEQLTCHEAAFAINKQLDGRLSLAERRSLRAHLRACAECNTLAHSQRAQRRALKALVLVPLPATFSHWFGGQSAAAATGAGVAGAGAGAGVSSLVAGGAVAKVAAVVAVGLAAGGTYEGVKHVRPALRNAQPAVAAAAPAAKPSRTERAREATRRFETPKLAVPRASLVAQLHAAGLKRAEKVARRTPKGKSTAPGRTVKTLAGTRVTSTGIPPGQVVRSSRANTPATTHSSSSRASTAHTATPAHGTPAQSKAHVRTHPTPPATAHGHGKPVDSGTDVAVPSPSANSHKP